MWDRTDYIVHSIVWGSYLISLEMVWNGHLLGIVSALACIGSLYLLYAIKASERRQCAAEVTREFLGS